jgi:hypothetical protein
MHIWWTHKKGAIRQTDFRHTGVCIELLRNLKGNFINLIVFLLPASFWQSRSFTLMDLYADPQGETGEKCGDINFGIDYDFPTQTFKLKLIQVRGRGICLLRIQIYLQGKDLAARDLNGLSDPYVRITLLPDKKHRLETKIKRRTLNPKWNETFYFEG